jgi:putative ABC transport system permease protein
MGSATRGSLEERGIDLVVTRRGMVELFSGVLPEDLGARLAAVAGVAAIAPELVGVVPVGEDLHAIVAGWPDTSFQWRDMALERGRRPVPGQGEVAIGEALAEALQRDVGSTIELNFAPFRVVAITRYANPINRGMAVMPLADLQALLARPGQVSLFHVRTSDGRDPPALERVRREIAALRSDITVNASENLLRSSRAIAIIAAGSAALSLLALASACLAVLNTLAMAGEERTREIGILTAIGWTQARIVSLVVCEGVILAVIGSLAGIVLGYAGARGFTLVLVPGGDPQAGDLAGLAATGVAAAIGVGTLGALYPALRAARMDPAAALRHP